MANPESIACAADDEDPLNDELAIEEDLARMVRSAKGTDNLQDLDR